MSTPTADEILIGSALKNAPIHDYLDEGGLLTDAFDEPIPHRIWGLLRDYFQEHGDVPDLDLLQDLAVERVEDQSDDIIAYARRAVNAVDDRNIDNSKIDYYVRRLLDTHEDIDLRRKLGSAIDILDKEGPTACMDYLQGATTLAITDTDTIKTTDLLEDFEIREEDVHNRHDNPGESSAVPLGIAPIDRVLNGGLLGGELMVFAAIPSGGKSVSLIDVAISSAEEGRKVHFFTIEMGLVQTAFRGYSRMSGVSTKRFRNAENFTEADFESWNLAVKKLRKVQGAGVKITSIPEHASTRYMRAELARLERKEGWKPDLILVDYAGIMRPSDDGKYKHESDWAFVGQNVKDLKTWSIGANVPIVSAVQLLPDAIGKDTLTFKDLGLSKILIAAHCDVIAAFIPLSPEELEFAEILKLRLQWLKAREGTEDENGKPVLFTDLNPNFSEIRIHAPSAYIA